MARSSCCRVATPAMRPSETSFCALSCRHSKTQQPTIDSAYSSLPLDSDPPFLTRAAFQISEESLCQEEEHDAQPRQEEHFDPQRPKPVYLEKYLPHGVHAGRQRDHRRCCCQCGGKHL